MTSPSSRVHANADDRLPDARVEVLRVPGRSRGRIASDLDGRHGALHPSVVAAYAQRLASQLDVSGVDKLLGLPEGGVVPAYALAAELGRPLVLATVFDNGRVTIDFEEQHAPAWRRTKRIFGLVPGDHVLVVEDEVSTGMTAVNCVIALRAAGMSCDTVATFLAIDHPRTRATFERSGVTLVAARWLPGALLDELLGTA